IASIEGTIAINYLLSHKDFPLIDANGDGIITAQEIQNFTDTAASKGLAEAGAMAALLGGTSTYAQPETGPNNTVFNENPDQPGALQRRFNYFDYLANGQLQGGISISSFKMLAKTLLPQPDGYVIVDRQRASANGFLVAPLAQRNFVELQHLLPKYMWVPASAIKKYRNLSPANFGVNRNEKPGTALPFYSLFGGSGSVSVTTGTPVVKTATSNGQTFSVSMVPLLPASSSSTPTTTTTTTTPYVSSTPTTTSTTAATTSTAPATATASSTLASSSTTPSTTTPVAQATTGSTTTSTTETAAQAVVAAVTQLANAQSASSTSPNNLVPAGTLTPVAQTTSTTPATTASTSTASTTTASKTTTAASTTTTTPTTTATASASSAASGTATVAPTTTAASTTTASPTTTATPAATASASPAAAAAANQK